MPAKFSGATYNEYMTSNATVLVCHDPHSVNQEKLRHASEWGVPAVSADWLWESIRAGQKEPFDPYLVKRQTSQGEGDKVVERRNDSQNKHTSQVLQPKQGATNKEVVEIKENTPDVPQEKQPVQKKPPQHAEGNSSRQEKQQNAQKRPFMWQSASPSPRKEQNQSTTDASSIRRKDSDQSGASAAQTINGLLKQARAANTRSTTDSSDQNDSNIRQRRRKPLLGRAPSLSSARNVSRASSIDTLNEDGCGSGLESAEISRTNSRNGPRQQQQQQQQHAPPQSISSLFSGSKFDFNPEAIHHDHLRDGIPDSDEEQEPPMTQLNYEDPDAVAMRQQFLRKAGKLVDEDTRQGQTVVVGEMREVEDTGWGTGRRTRKSAGGGKATKTDGLEKF